MAATSSDNVAPVTLHDWAVNSNDPMVNAITQALYFTGTAMTDIPWQSDKSFLTNIVRYITVPTPNWVPVNSPAVSINSQPMRDQEQAYIMRNNIDIDRVMNEDKNVIGGPGQLLAGKVENAIKGIAYDFDTKFINNAHVAAYSSFTPDPNAFVGLRYRLDNPATSKVVAENKINSGGVDLSKAGITSSTANAFIEYLDQACAYTGADEGQGCTIYMNEDLIRRFDYALRLLGVSGFGFQKDVYGLSARTYKNAVIKSIGRIAPAIDGTQTVRVITSTEDVNGNDGGTQYTSLYVVRYSKDQFYGKQFEPLTSKNLGLMPDGSTMRWFFEWVVALIMQSPRSFSRVYGIKIGA